MKATSSKAKHGVPPVQTKRRGYVCWHRQMDEILISVFYVQLAEGNKGDGDWKSQAYQAVVDEMIKKLNMSLTTDHVRNRVKIWKKHYGAIMEIRNKTKFKWDEEKKMFYMAEWLKYTQDNEFDIPYSNKFIYHWDDICLLFGPDRALGDEAENHQEGIARMEEETMDVGGSSADTTSNSSRKKQKRDQVAEGISCFADSFKRFVEAKMQVISTLSGKEVYDEDSKVFGLLDDQVFRALKILMDSPRAFQLLKDLPEEKKLECVLVCLGSD